MAEQERQAPSLKMIVATTPNRVIALPGKAGLPWGLAYPEDLRRFQQLTMGCSIIVGRKTWETMPHLKGRKVLVLSRYKTVGDELRFPSRESALAAARAWGTDCWVIGGASVYEQFIPLVDWIDHSILLHEAQPDIKGEGVLVFPPVHQNKFELAWEGKHPRDSRIAIKQWRRKC